MSDNVGRLLERLNTETELFTVSEVRALMEYVERSALNDIYGKTRILQHAEMSRAILEKSQEAMETLVSSWEPTRAPVFKVVNYEQTQEERA